MESLLAGKRFYCREWAFQKLTEILDKKGSTEKTCGVLIVGSPGCGKTAFLSETGEYDGHRATLKTRVGAAYYCCPSAPSSRKLSHFLKSISQQLRSKFKTLSLPTQIGGTDLRALLDTWNSSFKSYPAPSERYLIIVDGLELCYDIFGILSILAFPDWLVPVYSVSRGAKRSREIIKTLDKICHRFPFDDVRKPHVSRDTQQYILRRLESDPPLKAAVTRDTAENLNQLHIKASGCFLYLELVLDGISDGSLSLRQVREIPGTLSGLWLWLVQRIFGKKLFNSVRAMLELLVAAQRPVKTKTIHAALSLKDKVVTLNDVSQRLELFGPLLVQKRNGWLPIHNSFLAWCQDVKYSTSRYLCDPLEGHWTLACFHARTCHTMKESLKVTSPEFSDHDYRKETENLVNHIQHCQLSENEASVLLISVGHEREAVRFMKKLAGNSLHESGCQLTHFATRGELKQVEQLLTDNTNPNGTQNELEEPILVPLVAAARFGNCEMVRVMVENGADTIRSEYPNKHTFLHAASQHGHCDVIEMARELVSFEQFGELLACRDAEGRTPLRLAAWQGNNAILLQLAKYTSEHSLDIDQGDLENRSPLFAAAYMQHAEAVSGLLSVNADPNRFDRDHRAPLNIAALQNQVEICHQLLVAGADVNHADLDGLTALHTACYEQHVEIVRKLIEFGADVDLQDNTGISPLMASTTTGNPQLVDLLLTAHSSLDFLDQECRTVLSIAAQQGHGELVKKYLDLGLDETHTDNCGWTPLHLVAAENHAASAQILLEYGANPDQKDNDGRSALIIASMEGHLDMIKCLLQAGADPDIRAYDGCSALRYATLEGHVEVVKALVDAMADVDSLDNDGRSIMYACVLDQNIKMAQLILRLGADPEAEDEEGRRPIHVAAWQGTTELVEMLLEHGALPDATDSEGRTALQNSAWQNHVPVVKILAEAGASLCHSCHQGATPLCVAAQEGHLETCQVLIKLGANPHQPDACGRTPLRVAEKAGHTHLAKILAETPPKPLQTIKPTNLLSSTSNGERQGNSSHTNSSGFVSDQNPDLINSPTNRKRGCLDAISSDSETEFTTFADEIKHFTLPRSLRRSTLKLNDVENIPNQMRQAPRPNLMPKRLINPIAETKNPESFDGSSPSHSSSLSKSVNSKVSKNSNNLSSSHLNQSLNVSLNMSQSSTPSKLASSGTKMRRSASIKGKMTQLSKRVSKIRSSEDSGDLGLSYKRVTATARENLASGISPEQLLTDKIPIEHKLPPWAVERANVSQMEFECDQRTAAQLQINDMIHQSLRRPNKR